MYVTRPLSMYKRDPSALSLPPPEGPNSGILVIQDEAQPTCCFGFCKRKTPLYELPFPQNYNLQVQFRTLVAGGTNNSVNRVVFIPVLNQPLSSNQYYCIEREGKHKGPSYDDYSSNFHFSQACKNSKQDDKTTCESCRKITDVEPETFDPQDIYQQFKIPGRENWGYFAKAVAHDGYPPFFLRRKGWILFSSTPLEFELTDAAGLDKILRARLPDFNNNFPLSEKNSLAVVVGKWHCPFMFIKDRTLEAEGQIDSSRYYEMTLEQRWERIFVCRNEVKQGNVIRVNVEAEAEAVAVAVSGKEVLIDVKKVVNGVMWFSSSDKVGDESGVGLSTAIVERMKWEQERFGWIGENQKKVRVKRKEEFRGQGEWKKFDCYILVERFVLKRMDGRLVLTYDFRHTKHIRSKWE